MIQIKGCIIKLLMYKFIGLPIHNYKVPIIIIQLNLSCIINIPIKRMAFKFKHKRRIKLKIGSIRSQDFVRIRILGLMHNLQESLGRKNKFWHYCNKAQMNKISKEVQLPIKILTPLLKDNSQFHSNILNLTEL